MYFFFWVRCVIKFNVGFLNTNNSKKLNSKMFFSKIPNNEFLSLKICTMRIYKKKNQTDMDSLFLNNYWCE